MSTPRKMLSLRRSPQESVAPRASSALIESNSARSHRPASPARSTHPSVSQGEGAGHWNLQDLKRIQEARSQKRAETLIGRIKRMASDFRASPQQEAPISFSSERQIRDSLFRLNQTTKVLRIEATAVSCRAPRVFGLPRLFAPYGLKGGAARLAVEAVLGYDVRSLRPRDIDLVRIGGGDDPSVLETDAKLAQEHMPDDFVHGFGVERSGSIDQYLATRDFTINQAILIGGQLICTRDALQDTFQSIIRPTSHLLSQSSALEGKMFMKALRLCAERRARGESSTIEDMPTYCLASPFDVALHLARSEETSAQSASHYLALAFEFGALDPELCVDANPFSVETKLAVWRSLEEQLGESLPRPQTTEPPALKGGFTPTPLGLRRVR